MTDSLEEIKKKLGRCSEFTVRVHKSKIPEVEKVDKKLFTSIDNIKETYGSEHTTLTLKFDYKDRKDTVEVWQTILNITRYFQKNKDNKDTFEKVEVKGEERSKNLKLDVFNLITDKLTSKVTAERRENSKSIVSVDFLNSIAIELNDVIGL